jgi:tetratricopeptide (TPR) repeat protein
VRAGRLAIAALVLLGAPGCRRDASAPGGGDPLAEPRALVDEGRFDDAIARLGESNDPEALYLLGRAWAGKAQTAPVPTPAPGSAAPAGSLLKPEEQRALAFYERATAARPDHAGAHLATAQLLAAHALLGARAEGKTDTSVDRVLRSFDDALQADPAGIVAVEEMIRFATAAGRVSAADEGFQELVRRRREDPEVLVRYGDFLAGPAGNADGALARYAQALIWRPDDAAIRLKMAEIHLAAASALLAKLQYAAAEARLRDARRFVADPASPQAARLRELEGRLRDIRGR